MIDFLLSWALPILVGGLIGYLTNDIAIKMLFRPLREKRLFGMRIPFTPGILPKNRHRLAASIGNTVAQELITEDVLKKRIEDPVFRDSVEKLIQGFTSDFLSKKLESLKFPEEGSAEGAVVRLIAEVLDTFVASDSFGKTLKETATGLIESLGGMRLEEFLPPAEVERIARRVLDLTVSEDGHRKIVEGLEQLLDKFEKSGKSLADILPEGFSGWASNLVDAVYPKALDAALDYLRSPLVRKELEFRGGFFVKGIIGRLTVLQRLIIAAAKYDRSIIENMPGIVDDLLQSLEEGGRKPESRASVVAEAGRLLSSWTAKSFAQVRTDIPDIREKLLAFAESATRLAEKDDFRAKASALAARAFQSLSSKSVLDLARVCLGVESEDIARFVSEKAQALLKNPESSTSLAKAIAKFVSDYIESNSEKTIAEALGFSMVTKAKMDGILAAKSLEILEVKIPDMLKTVGIRELVVERVNSLDVEDVEKIVLDFMKEEFKWIDFFGFILGALIGFVQAMIAYLS